MALTRARVVAGPPALRARVETAIAAAIAGAGDAAQTRADATAMRARMLRELPPDGAWDVKLRPGGLVEVEFIAQVLQLVYAQAMPGVCSPTTRIALSRLSQAGVLPAEDTALLIHAEHVWRTVQGMLRITVGRHAEESLPDVSARPLLRATAAAGITAVDTAALRGSLDGLAGQVRAAFNKHVGEIRS